MGLLTLAITGSTMHNTIDLFMKETEIKDLKAKIAELEAQLQSKSKRESH